MLEWGEMVGEGEEGIEEREFELGKMRGGLLEWRGEEEGEERKKESFEES